jgi:tripartite ATP-independent transporter DctP family solute receptor
MRMRHAFPAGMGYWTVLAPEGFAGWILLTPLDLHGPEIEIGWRLVRSLWGCGYALKQRALFSRMRSAGSAWKRLSPTLTRPTALRPALPVSLACVGSGESPILCGMPGGSLCHRAWKRCDVAGKPTGCGPTRGRKHMNAQKAGIAVAGAVALALYWSAAAPAWAADPTATIRMSHTLPATDPVGLGAERFKEIVEKMTHGTVKVAIFPNNQLGGENQVLQQEKQGSIQMAVTGAGTVGNLVPDISVLDAPYIWKDWETEKKVLSGPVFQHFQKELEATQGLKLLSATWFYGRRNLTCNKPVRKPEDAEGLKIRTPPAPVNLLSAEVLGGKGTPMDFPQVYLALKTGTIDCEENPLPTILSGKLYEVQKYIMVTHHIQQSQIVTMNLASWSRLSHDQQQAVQTAADEAGAYATDLGLKAEETDLQKMQGMKETQVVTDIDLPAFVARARQLDPRMKTVWGDLYDQIIADQR